MTVLTHITNTIELFCKTKCSLYQLGICLKSECPLFQIHETIRNLFEQLEAEKFEDEED